MSLLYGRLFYFALQICKLFGHNLGPGWNLHVLRNNYHSIPDDPLLTIKIDVARKRTDDHAFPDTHVLVNDGSFDIAVGTDSSGDGGGAFTGIVVIGPHKNRILDLCARGNLTADSNHGMSDLGILDTAAI